MTADYQCMMKVCICYFVNSSYKVSTLCACWCDLGFTWSEMVVSVVQRYLSNQFCCFLAFCMEVILENGSFLNRKDLCCADASLSAT